MCKKPFLILKGWVQNDFSPKCTIFFYNIYNLLTFSADIESRYEVWLIIFDHFPAVKEYNYAHKLETISDIERLSANQILHHSLFTNELLPTVQDTVLIGMWWCKLSRKFEEYICKQTFQEAKYKTNNTQY